MKKPTIRLVEDLIIAFYPYLTDKRPFGLKLRRLSTIADRVVASPSSWLVVVDFLSLLRQQQQ